MSVVTAPAPAPVAVPAAPRRGRVLLKAALAAALAAAADALLSGHGIGSVLGLWALLLLAAALAARPAVRRSKPALAAAGAACIFALILADDPSLLAWILYWGAAAMAALLPRAPLDDALRWAARLAWQGFTTLVLPVRDLLALRSARRRRGRRAFAARAPVLALPLLGSLVFLALFARANPLIAEGLAALRPDARLGSFDPGRTAFWLLAFTLAWSLLRPSAYALPPARSGAAPAAMPGVSLASMTLSLLAFNAIFALQNALDIAFLWSGAPLPEGMTLAQYAHRGAYPLIVTALLAGLFVLVTLSPASPLAASGRLRRLVSFWIAQNVLLVASTMLRTLDYIEAYSLTRLRIAALIWMALVAVGLLLVCYRIWRGRSGVWLINANAAAALLALTGCAAADLGAVAAAWNVRHAREVGGSGARLDLCYLESLGASALPALIELEGRRIPGGLRDRAVWVRSGLLAELRYRQSDRRLWTLRGARRLAAADAAIAARRLPEWQRQADGCEAPRSRPHAPLPPAVRMEAAPPPPPAQHPLVAVPPAPALTPPAAR